MYLNPYETPYSITIYTPTYLHLVEYGCRLLSVDYIDNIYRIYIIGRIISFCFTLLGVYYVYLFAKKWLSDFSFALFVCALYLLLLTGHSYAVRPDSMKVAFLILFLYYYIDYFFQSGNGKSKILALLFAILSVAAKQDAVIYIGLIQTVTILFRRTWKEVKFLFLFIAGFICLFAAFHFMYGEYCLSSLFLFNLQGISDYRDSYNFLIVIFNLFRLLPFFILFMYCLFLKKENTASLLRILAATGMAAGILSSFFLFRPGSYLNYTYELIAIAIFTLIVFLKENPVTTKTRVFISGTYIIFILVTNSFLNIYTLNLSKEKIFKNNYGEYYQLREALKPLLQNRSSIYNPDLQLSIFIADYNVIYGQEYHLDRLIYGLLGLKTTSRLISVSSAPYDKLFTTGKVDYMLIKDKKESKEVIEKYYPGYLIYQKNGKFLIYKSAVH